VITSPEVNLKEDQGKSGSKISERTVPAYIVDATRSLKTETSEAIPRAGSWSLRALRLESDCGPLVHICNIDD